MTPQRLKSNGYRLPDRLPGHRAAIVAFVADRPDGRSCAEIAAHLGIGLDAASTTCWQMVVRSGTLFRGRPDGRRITRYFASQALADAWSAAYPPPISKAKQRAVARGARNAVVAQAPAVPAPVTLLPSREAAKPVREPVFTSKTKRTSCPSWTHDPRYQVAPGVTVVGLFSALGPGRYIEETAP